MSQARAGLRDTVPATSSLCAVDNTDWLKAAAIIFVSIDHFGHFFMDDDHWWAAVGRLAAPSFFFLMGYAQTRAVPPHWIWLGILLTLLNSWNAGWSWVAPNILLSLAFTRFARPFVEAFDQRYGWAAFVLLVCVLLAALPVAAKCVDYGVEGWLWALFGLYQRYYVDGRPAGDPSGAAPQPPAQEKADKVRLKRLLACAIAVTVYVWQEQKEFSFPAAPFAVLVLGVAALSVWLCLFRRGRSPIQLPEPLSSVLRFIGRHTLEIYAIQLAGSELLIKLLPGLAP